MTNDIEPADTFSADTTAATASAQDYDALIMPGGTVDADVLNFVRDIFAAGERRCAA